MTDISRFTGVNRYLSNFYIAPTKYEGIIYPSSEHAFQAAKTLDTTKRRSIRNCVTPGEAKRKGRLLLLRSDWESKKYDIMLSLLRDKFKRTLRLGAKLVATGDAVLREGNHWGDKEWGCTRRTTQSPWVGKNLLGKALMEVRTELIETGKQALEEVSKVANNMAANKK